MKWVQPIPSFASLYKITISGGFLYIDYKELLQTQKSFVIFVYFKKEEQKKKGKKERKTKKKK
jgi:hypothetical protein